VFVSETGDDSPPRRSLKKSDLQKIGFVDVFDGVDLFAKNRGDRIDADGPTVKSLDDRAQQLAVDFIEPLLVDVHPLRVHDAELDVGEPQLLRAPLGRLHHLGGGFQLDRAGEVEALALEEQRLPKHRLKIDVELLLVETLGRRNDWHLCLRL